MSKLANNNTFSFVVASKAAALLLCLFASCFFMRAQQYRAVKDTVAKADTVKVDTLTIRKPLLGVSTNALYDLAITPNVAVEYPFGKNKDWSVLLDYTFPWWVNRANDMAWQILKLDVGARKYFRKKSNKDVLTGFFVGLDLGAGYYDIEPKHKGWQGEFQTAGVEGGYAWTIGKKKNWRMQAFAAVGWMGTHYRYYVGNDTDTRLMYKYSGRFNWIGPTKVGVSFQYIIHTKKKQEQKKTK